MYRFIVYIIVWDCIIVANDYYYIGPSDVALLLSQLCLLQWSIMNPWNKAWQDIENNIIIQ